MKPILKQLTILAVFFAAWYLGAFGLSYIIYPDQAGTASIDTEEASKTIFQSPARYAALGLPSLAGTHNNNIFLIGSSNVREGFRPHDLGAILPEYSVQNLGMGASNITQAKDVVELIGLLPKPVVRDSIFVLGIWYGSFVDDKTHWADGASNVAREETRYGLYKISGGQPRPVVEMRYLPYLVTALRPFLLLQAVNMYEFTENLKTVAHVFFRERKIDFSAFRQEERAPVQDAAFRGKALKFWSGYMGTKDRLLKEEQFEKLLELCRRVGESGARIIIVDMPLPKWHRDGSPYYADYELKKTSYINEALKIGCVRYFNMQGAAADNDFRDSAHPRASAAKDWSALLGPRIRSMLDEERKV